MYKRAYWTGKIQDAWKRHNLIWLAGVRRVGKTKLCESIEGAELFDCEKPRVRKIIEGDPESFLNDLRGRVIVLDEVHRLANPSEVLKIAADYHPDIRLIATGSSTLGASRKFKDTLTGRKTIVRLTPMISDDLVDFGNTNLDHRFLHGGLPSFFTSETVPEGDYQEWIDSYWAKDILELYSLRKKDPFQKLTELIFSQSGGQFNADNMGKACGITHTTAAEYLEILKATFVVHVIRPFSTNKKSEIVKQPKVFAFDTGFVCYFKGIASLRPEDRGALWEHYVLNELQAKANARNIMYWRTKGGRELEVDFIIPNRRNQKAPTAIECKWSDSHFESRSMEALRDIYPDGLNFVVCRNIDRSFSREMGNIKINFVSLDELVSRLAKA